MKHLLSLQSISAAEMTDYVELGLHLKKTRGQRGIDQPLAGQSWALIFNKSSTRTRVSFEVGIHELGGQPMFFSGRDLQLGRGEPIMDTARVLGRMAHGAIIRTFEQKDVEDFAQYSHIPTINALTDEEHPCQILADLMTIKEEFGAWEGKKVVFLGDAVCNVARSWMWAAARLGFQLVLCGPEDYVPLESELRDLPGDQITVETDPKAAAAGADVLYTDVWVSMGREEEEAARSSAMKNYQINHALLRQANPRAVVLHCLPAYRGKEITAEVLEEHADIIFREAENRLHVQKAILTRLAC